MARIKLHLLLRFTQRTWTEASGGHSRALGLCARDAAFCAHASLFNVVSGSVGAWRVGMGAPPAGGATAPTLVLDPDQRDAAC